MPVVARLVAAACWCVTGVGIGDAPAQSSPQVPRAVAPAALDVPYLPQSVLLCGGAAVAMVERWWGRRGVYAEDFAELVRPELGGILTTELAAATRARGWNARVVPGTPALVQESLRDGVPVVALIEVDRERYHYVVIVGWHDGRVVYHDPADAPSTSLSEERFVARWAGARHWALVIRPPPASVPVGSGPRPPASSESLPCAPWLDRALDAADAGRLDEAMLLLTEAGRACPSEPLVLREMAGVRFRQGRHAEANGLAARYTARAPADTHGWQLLATSRYLTGDLDGALQAWNQVGRPRVDLVRIDGTRAIRFQALAAAMSVPHGAVLTPSRLALARRRMGEIPALRGASVEFQPVAGGTVEVRAVVAERPVLDRAWRLAAAGAIRAVAQNEVALHVATPTKAGELWTAGWRWESARPRTAIGVDMPARLGLRGVIHLESAWERFPFALDTGEPSVPEETRRSAVVGYGGWITAGARPAAALRLEHWSGNRDYLAASIGGELRGGDDRFALAATGEHAMALSPHSPYTRGSARARWASSTGLGRAAWSSQIGVSWASARAPIGAWPVADGNLSWAIPLRGSPRSGGGLLTARRAGRGILHGGLAGDVPVARRGPIVLAAGLFMDGAEIIAPADGSGDARLYLDGGAGIRIGIADGHLGVLRIDVAKGLLADRRSALTVGLHQQWPPFRTGPH